MFSSICIFSTKWWHGSLSVCLSSLHVLQFPPTVQKHKLSGNCSELQIRVKVKKVVLDTPPHQLQYLSGLRVGGNH